MKVLDWIDFGDSTKAYQYAVILRQSAAIFTGILLAQAGFAVKDIGGYEYIFFYLSSISLFWLTGISSFYTARFHAINEIHLTKYLTQLIVLLSTALSLIIIVLYSFNLISFLQNSLITYFLVLLLLYIPSMFLDQILLVQKQAFRQFVYSSVFFVLQILAVSILWIGKFSFEYIYWIVCSISGLKFILLVYESKAYAMDGQLISFVKRIFPPLLPFLGYFLVSGFASISDGWIIKFRWHDDGMYAVYKYGARDLPIIGTLAIGLGTALLPNVSQNISLAMVQIKHRSARLMHFVYPIMIVMVAFSDRIFPFIFNVQFKETGLIFGIYAFVIGARFLYPQTLLSGLGYNKFLFYNSIVELAINIVVSLYLSQYIGLAGIAVGTVVAFYYDKLSAAYYLMKVKHINIADYTPLRIYLFYNTLLALIFVISHLNL